MNILALSDTSKITTSAGLFAARLHNHNCSGSPAGINPFSYSRRKSSQLFRQFIGSAKAIAFVIIFLASLSVAQAVTKVAATGSWNTGTTWNPVGVPASGDDVQIPLGVTLTGDVTTTCNTITFTGSGTTAVLTINTGITVTVTGAITLNSSASASTGCAIQGLGTLACGSVSLGTQANYGATTTNIMTSTISNFNISGNLSIISNRYTPLITYRYNNSTFAVTSGTVTVNGVVTPTTAAAAASIATISLGNSSPTLILTNAAPFGATGNAGLFTTTLTGTGATVNYSGTAQSVQ